VPLYEAQRTVDGITAKLWLSTNRRDNCRRRVYMASSLPHLSERSASAWGLSLLHLLRHPIHGALKWKPSGISVAVVSRPRCGGQFRLSFFRRRTGPRRSGEVTSEPKATSCREIDELLSEGATGRRSRNPARLLLERHRNGMKQVAPSWAPVRLSLHLL
jgi:hypothetical protein